MVPSARPAGPEANKEGSRTALGRMGENEKHRGNDRRQPPLSSISHPMLPARRSPEPDGRVRVSRMPPIPESAVYVKRREWHSYIDDTGHLHSVCVCVCVCNKRDVCTFEMRFHFRTLHTKACTNTSFRAVSLVKLHTVFRISIPLLRYRQ